MNRILSFFFRKKEENLMEQEYRARAVAHRRGRYAGNMIEYQVASSFELEIREPRTGFGLECNSFLDAFSDWTSSRAIRSLPGHQGE